MKAFNFFNANQPIGEIDLMIDSAIPYAECKQRAVNIDLEGENIPVVSIIDRSYRAEASGSKKTRPFRHRTSQDSPGEIMQSPKRGFSYSVNPRKIEEYKTWPIKRRLRWLFYGNKLRNALPRKLIALQDAFRNGSI